MTGTAIPRTIWPAPVARGRAGQLRDGVVSLGLGVAFTAALFSGIAYYQQGMPDPGPASLDDFSISALPLEPPPPPTAPVESVAEIIPVPGFDLAASESPVKVAATPPTLELLRPEDASRVPVANIELHLPTSFRPRADLRADPQHIYQRYEVDTLATALVEDIPPGFRRVMDGAAVLRATMIWVIEADGTVSNVRVAKSSGKPKFDELMVEMIKESIFSPSTKGGRKVRMMTSQDITVKWNEGSIFEQ
jgi:TonB family protein